jgi:hypothetical protein
MLQYLFYDAYLHAGIVFVYHIASVYFVQYRVGSVLESQESGRETWILSFVMYLI